MADNESGSSPSEDLSNKLQSIVNFIKDTRAKSLNLQTMPRHESFAEVMNLQPIFDALTNSEITEIDFGKMKLTNKIRGLCEILDKTQIKAISLESCSLDGDDVTSLMRSLERTLVTKLDISGNNYENLLLTDEQIHEFISHVANSPLQSLNLSSNRMLPFEKASLFMQTLSATQITCLNLSSTFYYSEPLLWQDPENLQALLSCLEGSNLTELCLASNEIDDSIVSEIAGFLKNSNLEKLDLCDNNITDFGVDSLVLGLIDSKITHSNLRANKIRGANELGQWLKKTKLRELDLSHNQITDSRIFSEPNFLQGSVLDSLKLANCCHMGKTLPLPIKELQFSELTYVDLSYANLEQVSELADLLVHSKITHIDLSGNEFSEESFGILGEGVKKSQLKYINLCHTVPWGEDGRGISSFLNQAKSSKMISVNISVNHLEDSAEIIAPTLANASFLALDLSDNSFGDNIISIANQLKFTIITDLNLCSNSIGDEGVTVLAKCLEETHVIILNLRFNSITSQGAEALALAFKKTKLRHLNLGQNRIEEDGIESLAEHARNSCITYLNVEENPGSRKLLIDCVLWENRKRIQQFADSLKQTNFFIGDSNIFEFDREFDDVDIDVFFEDCLKLYKIVSESPFVVGAIAQDKWVSKLKNQKCFKFRRDYCDGSSDIFIEDCERIYKKIVEEPTHANITDANEQGNFFNKKVLRLVLKEFPRKLVSFLGKNVEADVEQQISLLKKIEGLGLTNIVELLLLNRPLYVIDANQDILHPYVYKLLHKYQQPICNLNIEPDGVKKIIKYFTEHMNLDGASDVISLLSASKSL